MSTLQETRPVAPHQPSRPASGSRAESIIGQLLSSHNRMTSTAQTTRRSRSTIVYWTSTVASLLVSCLLANLAQSQQQQQQAQVEIYSVPMAGGADVSGETLAITTILPPVHLRPKVRVNIRDWTSKLGEDIGAVGNKTSCSLNIERFFDNKAQPLDPIKLRDNIINQTSVLLSQHRAAVNAIVAEAEKLVVQHVFNKTLRINYTDVHRLRNEADLASYQQLDASAQQALDQSMGSSGASGSGPGSQTPQFTSIGGGTPVPGPAEWQTPVKSIHMQVNRNFGDIPVNTSMSAVHLPLPIYAGQPEIMNGIAWTERLDQVFRRNLAQYAHVHHQYYGDHLGFLRTFPAHKWRIPRTDPDLFDARTRPWYVTGASSPKDIVILVDTSGSMTGLRREIAKGVVFEILDTLTNNDYFAVLRFSETATLVGLPKCPNLRTPKMTPELEEQCGLQTRGGAAFLSPSLAGLSAEERQRQQECAAYAKQQEHRGQYLRDHPGLLSGGNRGGAGGGTTGGGVTNGSYMSDEAYETSIRNVTNDIRDAYMLPATSRNIRYLKSNFSMPTAGIANFTHALMAGFELLQAYNRSADFKSSECNQAIMLITDGAIRSNDELFNRYNYPNLPIRVFTYMIGREVGDVSHTKAMACNNRGYYTHVINLGEIREQVQKYPPVMARPLVLHHHHPITWTSAYGDETHQVLTDWVLEIKRRERARIMLNEERERMSDTNSSDIIVIELTNIPEYDEQPLVDKELSTRTICEDMGLPPSSGAAASTDEAREAAAALDQVLQDELDPLGHNDLACHWTSRRADLLTSVVKPVFDNRNTTLMFQRILSKNIWTEQETQVRNAQLLGVASVDIRIADILKAAPSYLLGPNGYAILMGPSGFMLHHPDLRALLEDPFDKQSKILKPYFNAVDLTHVEQVYHRNESQQQQDSSLRRLRADDQKLFKLREAAIRGSRGSETFYVKRAIDCRRRPHIRQQTFHYGPIRDTPYSFMIALPQSYGSNRVEAKLELDSQSAGYLLKPSAFDLWTVHPDYKYCEASGWRRNSSSVSIIFDVLEWATNSGAAAAAKTPTPSPDEAPPPPPLSSVSFEQLSNLNDASHNGPANSVVCDQDLFGSLLFDAAATYEKPDSYCGAASIDPICDRRQSSFSFYTGQEDDSTCARTPNEMRSKLANIYGLEMSFLATRSGLTRVRVFDLSARIKKLADLFIQRHNKAVDELWYSRTVDWNMRHQEDATIITAPYNAYIRLIAKLRQRITQRHPAANDTRANCDPSLDEGPAEPAAATVSPPGAGTTSPNGQAQNDDPMPGQTPPQESAAEGSDPDESFTPTARINYNEYSSYEILDLIANSSVHISATQTAIANKASKAQRSPVAVTGLLYDYATFARKFLNATSLNIRTVGGAAQTTAGSPALAAVEICPNGACPTKCGHRNDTIDCLLVDNNGYIVVGEDLPHIGRSLVDYDERLMASLVERRIFHKIQMMDYQAICQRNDAELVSSLNQLQQQRGSSASQLLVNQNPSSASTRHNSMLSLELLGQLMSNLAAALVWCGSTALSMLAYQAGFNDLSEQTMAVMMMGQPMPWQLGSGPFASAQSAVANQSLLALLPNKTYLRPCERQLTLYETKPNDLAKLVAANEQNAQPEYYVTKCDCSGWYVFDTIPRTNLIMLIVNTTSACRRGCDQPQSSAIVPVPVPIPIPLDPNSIGPGQQQMTLQQIVANKTAEDQVCAMLERDAQLYWKKPETCVAQHPEESQIHLCGGANRSAAVNLWLLVLVLALAADLMKIPHMISRG